ncbi:MAG: LytR C-terminal domain-containing protein [Ignavibacteriaceae bacterium]
MLRPDYIPENNQKAETQKRAILFYTAIAILIVINLYLGYIFILKIIPDNSDSSEGNEKVKAKILQVEVLNGCGIAGAGDVITNFLRQKGFDVISTENYQTFDMDETIIIDRVGIINNGYKVADSLGITRKNVISQVNRSLLLDVSIIIGKDFNSFKQN